MGNATSKGARIGAKGSIVYWLPLQSAALHFQVEKRDLVAAVQAGELTSRRIVCGDDMAVALSSAELLQRYTRRQTPLAPTSPAGPGDSTALAGREALRDQAAELARVQANLEAAERVERALQRYADRLESELAAARRETLVLARALGRAEQLAASSAATPRRIVSVR